MCESRQLAYQLSLSPLIAAVKHHLGVTGKPYSDGELVKRYLIDVVKCIHPGKEADYSSIALSRVTM